MTVQFKRNLDGYTFVAPSRRQYKKYDVYVGDKYITSFGDNRFSQYKDRIGYYAHMNNNSQERKRLYYKRHGLLSSRDTPKYFSHKYLW